MVCLFRTWSVYSCGIVDEKSSVIVNPRRRAWGEKKSDGRVRQEGGGKREGAMATRGELDQEPGRKQIHIVLGIRQLVSASCSVLGWNPASNSEEGSVARGEDSSFGACQD